MPSTEPASSAFAVQVQNGGQRSPDFADNVAAPCSAHYRLRRTEPYSTLSTCYADNALSAEGYTDGSTSDPAASPRAFQSDVKCDALTRMCTRKRAVRPVKHEVSADESMSKAEERRLRRRTANRESARRVRDRRTQQSSKLEAQAAEVAAVNEQLLKRVARVERESALASSLLQAFHQKVAHLCEANDSLQAKIAVLQQGTAAQEGQQAETKVEFATPSLHSTGLGAYTRRSQQAHSVSSAFTCQLASPGEAHFNPLRAPGISPFATATPATTVTQAETLPLMPATMPNARSSLDDSLEKQSVLPGFAKAARADSMDAMLGVLSSDQPAANMRRMGSLALSGSLSAVLDAFLVQ